MCFENLFAMISPISIGRTQRAMPPLHIEKSLQKSFSNSYEKNFQTVSKHFQQ